MHEVVSLPAPGAEAPLVLLCAHELSVCAAAPQCISGFVLAMDPAGALSALQSLQNDVGSATLAIPSLSSGYSQLLVSPPSCVYSARVAPGIPAVPGGGPPVHNTRVHLPPMNLCVPASGQCCKAQLWAPAAQAALWQSPPHE